jgi:hypothetical protein
VGITNKYAHAILEGEKVFQGELREKDDPRECIVTSELNDRAAFLCGENFGYANANK